MKHEIHRYMMKQRACRTLKPGGRRPGGLEVGGLEFEGVEASRFCSLRTSRPGGLKKVWDLKFRGLETCGLEAWGACRLANLAWGHEDLQI